MKKKFTLAAFLFFAVASYGQTYISGFISANTTWTVAGAPYIVTANALVSQGYTLTIQPGVVVKFNTHCALQIDGQLLAVGTPASRITFTSNQPSPAAGDWDKLHFSGYCIGATFDSNGHYLSGSLMKYCDVLYAGGSGYGGVHIESSWPYISQCNIRLSSAAGIYCAGSTFILDSSLVGDNTGYGLYFNDFSHFSCGLVINGDTIRDNANGGLYLGSSSTSCTTMISNDNFDSNNTHGAIYDYITSSNINIENNFFRNNSGRSTVEFGDEHGHPNYLQNITIKENYFFSNNGLVGIIAITTYSDYFNVIHNYFSSNIGEGMVCAFGNIDNDSISCNTFLNNQASIAVIFMRSDLLVNSGIITNNIFDSNRGTVLNIGQDNKPLQFSYNIVRNNSFIDTNYNRGIYINAYLADSTQLLSIHDNEFLNNTYKFVIELNGPLTNNVHYDFLYFRHNNFLDPANEIELFNHIPYGSPNVYADSNYWGSTSTAHIDSVICDYFDSTNYSVVYYSPILNTAVEIDTSCTLGFPTAVAATKSEDAGSSPFPNPFSSYTEIEFKEDLKDAALLVYNVVGQKIKLREHIYGHHLRIERGNLPEGVYIYSVEEKGQKRIQGKFIIE